MFGFLLKIIIFVAIIAGVLGFVFNKGGSIPSLADFRSGIAAIRNGQAVDSLKNTDVSGLSGQLSSALDSLVTHPNQDSPVVLGLKITNESLNTMVDFIQNMPPEQSEQLKSMICKPSSPASASTAPTQ